VWVGVCVWGVCVGGVWVCVLHERIHIT
jgi:hypothetical protein